MNSTTFVFFREDRGERLLGDGEMRRLQGDEPRHAAGAAHQRQIGVVHRLEQNHLVARFDQRHQRPGQSLGGAGGDHHLALRIEIEALPMLVMRRDRLAQDGQAEHGRILVPALDHGLRRALAHILRARIIGKALAEIDRIGLPRDARHFLEDRRRHARENGIHARLDHGLVPSFKR